MVRFKNRYLVCELNNTDGRRCKMQFSIVDFVNVLKQSVNKYHGDYGTGCVMTSVTVKHLNLDTGIALIRVKRGCHQMLQSTLTFITKIKNYNVMIQTLHIGGTIKSCQKFLIRYHQKQLALSLRQCKTKEERMIVQRAIKRSDNIIKGGKSIRQLTDPVMEDSL